jgi:hypothetical protein
MALVTRCLEHGLDLIRRATLIHRTSAPCRAPRHRYFTENMNTAEVILVTHADSDTGLAIARELLAAGHRVVVTAHHPLSLSRILLGQSAAQVIAIAADIDDAAQRDALLRTAHAKFGAPITRIVDGRDRTALNPVPLQLAS